MGAYATSLGKDAGDITDAVAVRPGNVVDAAQTPVVIGVVTALMSSRPRTLIPPGVEPGPTVNKFNGEVAVNWSLVRLSIASLDLGILEPGFLALKPL